MLVSQKFFSPVGKWKTCLCLDLHFSNTCILSLGLIYNPLPYSFQCDSGEQILFDSLEKHQHLSLVEEGLSIITVIDSMSLEVVARWMVGKLQWWPEPACMWTASWSVVLHVHMSARLYLTLVQVNGCDIDPAALQNWKCLISGLYEKALLRQLTDSCRWTCSHSLTFITELKSCSWVSKNQWLTRVENLKKKKCTLFKKF